MKSGKIIATIIITAIIAGGIGYGVGDDMGSNKTVKNVRTYTNPKAKKDTLVVALPSAPLTMNPMYANIRSSQAVTNTLYENLYNIGSNGEIQYTGLAKSLTHSPDCKTYTLTLKPGLKWSDGKPLTASDVVFTFNQIMNTKQNALDTQSFIIDNKPVTCKEINSTTVQFNLPAPALGFKYNLVSLTPIPEHIYKGIADIQTAKENNDPVGDGPYKFVSEVKGSLINLERNPYFEGQPAKIQNLDFRIIPDNTADIAALKSGEVDVSLISGKEIDTLKNQFNFQTFASGLVNHMTFNLKDPVLKNIKVREAIAYALNRNDLIVASSTSMKYAEPAYSTFAPETEDYTTDVTKYDQNINKAKELLAQSGEKNITLKLAYGTGVEGMKEEAQVIQQELEAVGINVEIMPMDTNAFYTDLLSTTSTTFDLGLNRYNMGNDPDSYAQEFVTGQADNCSKISNKEIDQLFAKAQISTNVQERASIFKEIQQKLSEQLPIYTISYPDAIIATRKGIDGISEAQLAPMIMFNNFGALYYDNSANSNN